MLFLFHSFFENDKVLHFIFNVVNAFDFFTLMR